MKKEVILNYLERPEVFHKIAVNFILLNLIALFVLAAGNKANARTIMRVSSPAVVSPSPKNDGSHDQQRLLRYIHFRKMDRKGDVQKLITRPEGNQLYALKPEQEMLRMV
jgi:hypothetical protein